MGALVFIMMTAKNSFRSQQHSNTETTSSSYEQTTTTTENSLTGDVRIGTTLLSYWPIGVIVVALLIMAYFSCTRAQKTPKQKKDPKKFHYLEHLKSKKSWQLEYQNAVIRCKKATESKFRMAFFSKPDLCLQEIIDKHYGKKIGGCSKFKIPNEAVTISIPRKNFKCGKECTDFEPRDGKSGRFTYETCSNNLQITWFHVNNETFMAGFCIYLSRHPCLFNTFRIDSSFTEGSTYNPNLADLKETEMRKQWCSSRKRWLIMTKNQFGEVDKFRFNMKDNGFERINCSDCYWEPEVEDVVDDTLKKNVNCEVPQEVLKFLKVEFCEIEKKPVTIGKDQLGIIKHFNWNPESGKFGVRYCKSCGKNSEPRFDIVKDEPPSYNFLELVELMEDW